jgi:hypothetical protein
MKQNYTQKLFWKRWPYKAIIQITPARKSVYTHQSWRMSDEEREARAKDLLSVTKWCKSRFPDAGIRREGNLSVFLDTETELQELVENWGDRVIATWQPQSSDALDLLKTHTYDVVRAKPWYGRFPIRARINYTDDFRIKAVDNLRSAMESMDNSDWYCAGLLYKIIKNEKLPRTYGWGQPLHLYLASQDDAAILRLQLGDYIVRFERIRAPD